MVEDEKVSLAVKTLYGEGYKSYVFWDTEKILRNGKQLRKMFIPRISDGKLIEDELKS